MEFKPLPPLFKRDAKGHIQRWEVSVLLPRCLDGKPVIEIRHGRLDGKVQVSTETVRAGKNTGKKNATSAIEQAHKQAKARWQRQKDRRHYGETVEESVEKLIAAPMLAHVYAKHVKKVDWETAFAQPKFNGHRCLARCDSDGVTLWSRKGEPITAPGHIIERLSTVMRPGQTFDGELYVHGVPPYTLGGWIKKQQSGTERIQYVLYDSVSDRRFQLRFHAVREALREARADGVLTSAMTVRCPDFGELRKRQTAWLAAGYEGAMLRYGAGGYEAGKRSMSLLKYKSFKEDDFEIVDVACGAKGNHDGVAIFICKTTAGHQFRVTAPGTLAQKRQAWRRGEELIGQMLNIRFEDYTATEAPVPFQPIALDYKSGFTYEED